MNTRMDFIRTVNDMHNHRWKQMVFDEATNSLLQKWQMNTNFGILFASFAHAPDNFAAWIEASQISEIDKEKILVFCYGCLCNYMKVSVAWLENNKKTWYKYCTLKRYTGSASNIPIDYFNCSTKIEQITKSNQKQFVWYLESPDFDGDEIVFFDPFKDEWKIDM